MKWLSLVNRYLQDRRSLGYKLEIDGRILQGFAAYADKKGTSLPLNLSIVFEWANLAHSGSEIAIARRIAIVVRPGKNDKDTKCMVNKNTAEQ